MEEKIISTKEEKILDEIISNSIGLPLESQDLLLMIAKSMRYTRNCMIGQKESGQLRESPKQTA